MCSACGYDKTDSFLFNKYFKDSYIKSLLLIIYCKQYYKILKNSNVLTLSNFQKQYLINDGFDSKTSEITKEKIDKQKRLLIENCYSTGDISGSYSGGIVGGFFGDESSGTLSINNCSQRANMVTRFFR